MGDCVGMVRVVGGGGAIVVDFVGVIFDGELWREEAGCWKCWHPRSIPLGGVDDTSTLPRHDK